MSMQCTAFDVGLQVNLQHSLIENQNTLGVNKYARPYLTLCMTKNKML